MPKRKTKSRTDEVHQTEFNLTFGKRDAPYVYVTLSPAQPTYVFDSFWKFAAERQEIFFRRQRGSLPPWTEDPVLQRFKFTNAYRAADRVSQFLIRDVLYEGSQEPREIFFRAILFKLFNKIATWVLLRTKLGEIQSKRFDIDKYDAILRQAMQNRNRVYSGAYIMPSAYRSARVPKHRTHLELLWHMLQEGLPERVTESHSLREVFEKLRAYPMMGDFLAFQYTIDLNYSSMLNFNEMEFVVPGPGARGGLRKCFRSLGGLSEADAIRLVTDRQEEEFARLGLDFKSLWGRPLHLIDCQNLFCEVDKYARYAHPEVIGIGTRQRIKQIFRAEPKRIDYWFPPKWGLNDKILTQSEEVHASN